jgi:hypothetical protein
MSPKKSALEAEMTPQLPMASLINSPLPTGRTPNQFDVADEWEVVQDRHHGFGEWQKADTCNTLG